MSAQPIRCDTGMDANLAAVMVTNVAAGEVVGLCPICAPDYLEGVAKAFRDALAPQPAAKQPAAPDGVVGDGARKRTRPRKRTPEASDVPTGADGQQAEPATQDAAAD